MMVYRVHYYNNTGSIEILKIPANNMLDAVKEAVVKIGPRITGVMTTKFEFIKSGEIMNNLEQLNYYNKNKK